MSINLDTLAIAFVPTMIAFAGDISFERRKNYKQVQKAKDIFMVTLYSRLSFEWKFVEPILGELFEDENKEVQAALRYIFGNAPISKFQ